MKLSGIIFSLRAEPQVLGGEHRRFVDKRESSTDLSFGFLRFFAAIQFNAAWLANFVAPFSESEQRRTHAYVSFCP